MPEAQQRRPSCLIGQFTAAADVVPSVSRGHPAVKNWFADVLFCTLSIDWYPYQAVAILRASESTQGFPLLTREYRLIIMSQKIFSQICIYDLKNCVLIIYFPVLKVLGVFNNSQRSLKTSQHFLSWEILGQGNRQLPFCFTQLHNIIFPSFYNVDFPSRSRPQRYACLPARPSFSLASNFSNLASRLLCRFISRWPPVSMIVKWPVTYLLHSYITSCTYTTNQTPARLLAVGILFRRYGSDRSSGTYSPCDFTMWLLSPSAAYRFSL